MSDQLKQAEKIVDSLPEVPEGKIDNVAVQNGKPLSGLNRRLTEDELKSPGVRKLLLGQLDDYEATKSSLESYRSKYHESDKRVSVLEAKVKEYVNFDWLYSGMLTIGSILIGYFASQPDKGCILLILGIASIALAFYTKNRHSNENKDI